MLAHTSLSSSHWHSFAGCHAVKNGIFLERWTWHGSHLWQDLTKRGTSSCSASSVPRDPLSCGGGVAAAAAALLSFSEAKVAAKAWRSFPLTLLPHLESSYAHKSMVGSTFAKGKKEKRSHCIRFQQLFPLHCAFAAFDSLPVSCCEKSLQVGMTLALNCYNAGDGRISFLIKNKVTAMDKGGYVVLDIDNLTQPPEKCYTGSPKMTKALSRKGSNRMDKRTSDEQEADNETKKLVSKAAPSQLDQLKQSLLTNKSLTTAQSAANAPMLLDSGEGHKRLNRLSVIHPHRVLLVFATM
ncbi:hypothetical protein MUK42_26870 [Musa troglodytarum]|nr:hypothetical protein MUK42_26870 [Musa troglodytarum]